jgi:NTE family protein
LQRLLPWNWFRSSTGVENLARVYETALTPLKLRELPLEPNFVLCATDMGYGVNWIFARDQMGDYEAGYVDTPDQWTLGRAVSASSCFPPIFNPLPVGLDPNDYRGGSAPADSRGQAIRRGLRLTDGGDYDNLGLEPVWKDHATLLASDGGAPLDVSQDQGLFWRVQRYVSIVQNQAHALRVRWLISNFIAGQMSGTYWGVASATSSYDPSATTGYSKALATDVIAKIRTDLDAFSDAEAAVLQNHGYLLADVAVRTHVPSLVPPGAPPAVAPYPEYMDEHRVRVALKDSSKRRLFRF